MWDTHLNLLDGRSLWAKNLARLRLINVHFFHDNWTGCTVWIRDNGWPMGEYSFNQGSSIFNVFRLTQINHFVRFTGGKILVDDDFASTTTHDFGDHRALHPDDDAHLMVMMVDDW